MTHASLLRPRRLVTYVALLLLTFAYLAPLLWMLSTSLKSDAEAVSSTPHWLPASPTLQGYTSVLSAEDAPVLRWFLNSLLAASLQALLVVATAAPAAYALARLELPGRKVLLAVVMSTLFLPPVTFLAPSFLLIGWLGWLDTLWAVAIPGAASAFGVFFLHQFFRSLPRELEEAAALDRASPLQVFWHVVLPLSKPALATLALLSFLTNWNDFLWPLYVLLSADRLTLPAGLSQMQSSYTIHYPAIMAGAVLASVPVLVLFLFAQRHVIEGVSRTGLKG